MVEGPADRPALYHYVKYGMLDDNREAVYSTLVLCLPALRHENVDGLAVAIKAELEFRLLERLLICPLDQRLDVADGVNLAGQRSG